MIQALRYEPHDQRQRFEPREQQGGERKGQDRHIHLHFHLNLTFRSSQGRSTHPNAIRITRILAALVGATVIPLWLFGALAQEGTPNTLSWIAGISFLAGLTLAWGFGGLPLLVSAWRSTPHVRFLLLVLLLIIPLSLLPSLWLPAILPLLEILSIHPLSLLFYVHPLISAILLTYVSRKARVLRQEATTHSRLSSVVVCGMLLMLLGGLLLNLSLMLGGGMPSVVVLLVICGAVIVAIRTLFGLSRSRENTQVQARPKDASASDVDSPGEPLGYRD